ncbi:hypothetical protein LXT21_28565 [Myxococcus sp. K38C18041901]|uniref:hypothetical protein n=1 Tax=Myxococcus guangdongensis TaxID=2906760 RepID=UPI0020A79BFE|nr:hypothetical protein [Myxococcus guangdongensis]MCP3062745.1 hypothetical protein [Myxococcus guangdongensis]
MPLPLIPAAFLLAGLIGYGAKKGYDGIDSMKDAKDIGEEAEARHQDAVRRLDGARGVLQQQLDALSARRDGIITTTFRRLFDFLEQLSQKARLEALERLGTVGVSREEVRLFAAQYLEAGGTLSGSVAAAVTGAGASALTTGLVTTFATAGTGAAMSGLSGAAANSALLAWLGGGSLASGGLGVAGGTVVLGGIAVAPAVAVVGFVLAHQGEKAKTKAIAYAEEVDAQVASIDAAIALLARACTRVEELSGVLGALDERAGRALDALWALGGRFDAEDDVHLARFATAMQLVKAQSELMRMPLFADGGDLNTQLETLLEQSRGLLQRGTS